MRERNGNSKLRGSCFSYPLCLSFPSGASRGKFLIALQRGWTLLQGAVSVVLVLTPAAPPSAGSISVFLESISRDIRIFRGMGEMRES